MEIKINRKTVPVPDGLQETPLVHFIRDHLDMKGTKYGCGRGLCGACTVHLDGVAVRSCQLWVSDAESKAITTIEGLANNDQTPHPVQQAWIEENVPQCGYCQPGQIMTAAAFLTKNNTPKKDDVIQEMNGNLCRCGTYDRILKAVLRAAEIKSEQDAGEQ